MIYIDTLASGILLGLSAGVAPGPLLTLVISQTLRHDVKEGLKVALAPLVTDLPIILFTLFILRKLAHFELILGMISLLGGSFILHLSYESVQTKPVEVDIRHTHPKSLKKGALVNALNPHPYLFWFSVGTPIMLKAQGESNFGALAFLVSFYAFLVGAKVVIALLVGKSRTFLAGNVYIYTMRTLGWLLFVFALLLFWDGLKLVGPIV